MPAECVVCEKQFVFVSEVFPGDICGQCFDRIPRDVDELSHKFVVKYPNRLNFTVDWRTNKTFYDIEREIIIHFLRRHYWNISRTAGALGLSIRGLRMKLHRYKREGIEMPKEFGVR